MDGLDETLDAQRRGELEAKAFDLRLRQLESRDREDRMTRLVAERPDLAAAPAPLPGGADTVQVEQLRRQVAQLAEFQAALFRSKGWRVLQMMRRPFGRSW